MMQQTPKISGLDHRSGREGERESIASMLLFLVEKFVRLPSPNSDV